MSTNSPEKYLEVSLEIPRVAVDPLSDFICTYLAHGMVIADEEKAPRVGVTFYLAGDEIGAYRARLERFLVDSIGFAPDSIPKINEKYVDRIEWVEEYRQSVRSLWIGAEIAIRPTWDAPTNARYEIIMEPKMAFGTGRHETTRSCLKAILANLQPGSRFLDYGCGSGVLSILADKMGASYICAIDYDQLATDNCQENFEINGVTTEHVIRLGSIEQADNEPPFEFVAVNILRDPILAAIDRIVELALPGGFIVLSGLLLTDEPAISAALKKRGQTDYQFIVENDWLTYVVKRV
jgi:ribosomal protein L11 methyltransferase